MSRSLFPAPAARALLSGAAFAVVALALSDRCAAGTTVPPVRYRVTDLGTLGGDFSRATGINDAGDVVGDATAVSTGPLIVSEAFVVPHGGSMRVVGSLGAPGSEAEAINNAGVIVGGGFTPVEGEFRIAFATDPGAGTVHRIPTLGGVESTARDVNASGQIVGNAGDLIEPLQTEPHAFFFDGTSARDLGTLGGSTSFAFGLNDAGDVVGVADSPAGAHAFLLHSGGGPMQDLGTLGGNNSFAADISNAGLIVGSSTLESGSRRAFVLPIGGEMQDLGALAGLSESLAAALNERGQIVGQSHAPGGENPRAFLFENGVIFDLNDLILPDSGFTITAAADINESGQIAATGVNAAGGTRALLLTAEPLNPIPLPPAFWGAASAGITALLAGRRVLRPNLVPITP